MSVRLTLALEGGLALPDTGPIAVFFPTPEADLSALPRERVVIIQPFYPFHQQFQALGYDTQVAAQGGYAAAIVFAPRAKPQARAAIEQALALTQGPVIVDGAKTDGIDSLYKDIRKRAAPSAAIAKAHGKLFWVTAPASDFADWAAAPRSVDGFTTAPGVFSADGIDPASQQLVAALPDKLGAQVADFGAGWGYLSAQVLNRNAVQGLHLIEADQIALDCARQNITDPRAQFHWGDARDWRAPALLDAIVMNPPFHTTRKADPDLGRAFITNAARNLAPSGTLWMVANRHLPYEDTLAARFRSVEAIGGTGGFKLIRAQRPSRLKG